MINNLSNLDFIKSLELGKYKKGSLFQMQKSRARGSGCNWSYKNYGLYGIDKKTGQVESICFFKCQCNDVKHFLKTYKIDIYEVYEFCEVEKVGVRSIKDYYLI